MFALPAAISLPNVCRCLQWLLLLAVLGCHDSHSQEAVREPEGEATPVVSVSKAAGHTLPKTVRVHGTLSPDETAVLGAKVPGRVAEVLVEVGDLVKAGQAVARLEDAQLRLEIRRAETQLAQACAAIGLTADDSTDNIVPENSPVVRQEKAVLDQARLAFERVQSLAAQNAVTQEKVDELEAAYKVAVARHAAALNALAEKVALIAVRRAELEIAKNALAESTILAPFEGVVQVRSTAAGAYLNTGDPVATLLRCDRLRFVGSVPEKQAQLVAVGQDVLLKLRSEPQPRTIQVTRFRPLIEAMSRALIFEADVPNPGCTLRPGLFAEADVVVDPQATALVVPRTAVSEFAGIEKVWRVSGDQAEEVVVQTGPVLDEQIVIISGLAEGDVVVTDAGKARTGKVIVQ